MTARLISDALTGAESREVCDAFLHAVERMDSHGDRERFVRELQIAVELAEQLAGLEAGSFKRRSLIRQRDDQVSPFLRLMEAA